MPSSFRYFRYLTLLETGKKRVLLHIYWYIKQIAHTVLVDGYTGAESPQWDVMWGKEMFYVRLCDCCRHMGCVRSQWSSCFVSDGQMLSKVTRALGQKLRLMPETPVLRGQGLRFIKYILGIQNMIVIMTTIKQFSFLFYSR